MILFKQHLFVLQIWGGWNFIIAFVWSHLTDKQM